MNLLLPVLTWLRGYDKSGLNGDVIAGVTPAAGLVRAGLGDATLANWTPSLMP
jgi:hypothetical protein